MLDIDGDVYVNIDVEQLELAILAVWPWDTYCVTLFNIENEPPSGTPSTSVRSL